MTKKKGRFKHGMKVNDCGYLRISAGPQRGMYLHRLVLEAKLGRMILPGHTAHHVDWNKQNNLPGPLVELTRSDHAKLENAHRSGTKLALNMLPEMGL